MSSKFRTKKVDGVVVGGECSLHGWLPVGSSGIYESVRSDGRIRFECRVCRNCRTKSHNIKVRKSQRPYQPKANHFRIKEVNGQAIGGECHIHGWLDVSSSSLYRRLKPNGRFHFECRACRNIRFRMWRLENREAVLARNKRPCVRASLNSYLRERRRTDLRFCVIWKLRARFKKIVRSKTTEEMLGCSYEQVVAHLGGDEKKIFGGKYHIDHIFPVSCFTFDETEGDENHHKEVCFNWRNLQLLTAEENRAKRDLLNHATQTREVLESFREIGLDVSVADGKMVVRKTEIFCDE